MNLIDSNGIDFEPEMSIYGLRIFRRLIELENTHINEIVNEKLEKKLLHVESKYGFYYPSYKWEPSEWK